jgi:hypothetical protein
MELGMRSKERAAVMDLGASTSASTSTSTSASTSASTSTSTSTSTSASLALALASLFGCSIGTGTGETFGSAASVGGNTQGSGSDDTASDGGSDEDDPDGSASGGGQEGPNTSDDPPGDTDDPPPGGEVCNGLDDDGDGDVDEDQPSATCGVGSCEVTEPSCVNGVPQECTPALPGGEICNGLDDDCNGTPDDIGGPCSTSCGEGTIGCMGTEQVCNAPPPQPESCNLLDDDCNGTFDDVGGCRLGVHRSVHPATGEHFYTSSLDEAQCCGFVLEAANFFQLYTGPHAGLAPFYRCYGAGNDGSFHFYTQDPGCEGVPVNEGALGYIATAEGTAGSVPLYRLYLASNGDHFFTTSAAERDNAVASFGYLYEGVAGYVW